MRLRTKLEAFFSILPELVGQGRPMVAYAPIADNDGGSSRKGAVTVAFTCDLCGKHPRSGHNVSHANNKTKRVFSPNLQTVRALIGGAHKRIRVCTRCLRSGLVTKAV